MLNVVSHQANCEAAGVSIAFIATRDKLQ